jgi:hypothetical protein
MTEIILSTPEYLNAPFARMEHDTLQSIFNKITTRKHVQVYCHALWSQPVDSLGWLVAESKKMGVSLTLCLNSSDTLENIHALVTQDVAVEVSLQPDSSLSCLSELADFKKVSFFLPLSGPDPNPAILSAALQLYPNPVKIRLGVGWSHRLSGPAPITEQHHQLWAASLIPLIDEIAARSLKIEFACGLKLCLFNRLQLGDLVTKNITWPISTCPKPFLFYPDGKLEPCFRLHLPQAVNISDIAKLSEVVEEMDKWLSPYSGLCYHSETFDCRSLRVKSCSTGCLEHSLGEWSS